MCDRSEPDFSENAKTTVFFHQGLLNGMESNFNMAINYFILLETSIIISYATLLTSKPTTNFKIFLAVGMFFSIFWFCFNFQYFGRYFEKYNNLVREFTAFTNSKQTAWPKKTFWEMWKNDVSFAMLLITPICFLALYLYLFFYT
jgi:hypothetical protein